MNNATKNSKEPRNRVGSRELVSLLSEWERIAFDREPGFLERFCHNAWQLDKVSWSSETMHVVYIAECGQHITDSFPLRAWLEFYQANSCGEPPVCDETLKSHNMKPKTSKNKKTTAGRTAARVGSDAMVRRFWGVMKAYGWDNLSFAGIEMAAPKEGPQHFIPVFDTREQAVAWAGTEEHVYALESVA